MDADDKLADFKKVDDALNSLEDSIGNAHGMLELRELHSQCCDALSKLIDIGQQPPYDIWILQQGRKIFDRTLSLQSKIVTKMDN